MLIQRTYAYDYMFWYVLKEAVTSCAVANVSASGQEQPSYDKKAYMGYVKTWLAKVKDLLPAEKHEEFMAKSQEGVKKLLKLLKELQL